MTHAARGLMDLVGDELRAELARRRLTQQDLAELIGEAQPWVSRRLAGKTPLNLDDLERMTRALDISTVDVIAKASAQRKAAVLRRMCAAEIVRPRLRLVAAPVAQ